MLAIVLGPLLESALKRSLILSTGSPLIFFQRPISLVLMCAAILFLVGPPLFRGIIKPKSVSK